MSKVHNEFRVSSTARGVTFERNKTGIKVESIFPNKEMAIAAAMAEAVSDADSALFVDGELYYFSEEVEAPEIKLNADIEATTVSEDIAYVNESDVYDSDYIVDLESNAPLVDASEEPDAESEAEPEVEVISLIDPSIYDHSTLTPSSSRSNVYWGYKDDNGKLTLDVVAFDRSPDRVKVFLSVDGKDRSPRNVVTDKLTSIVVKSYKEVSLFSYTVSEDGTEGGHIGELNIRLK